MRLQFGRRCSLVLVGILFAFSLSYLSISPSLAQESDEEIAVRFVRETQVNKNFKDLMTRAALVTTTFRIGAKEHGVKQASSKLSEELDRSVAKFGAEWDEKLARAYLTVFSADELESLRREKRSSPYFKKFRATLDEVGITMRDDAAPLLKTALKEALVRYFEWVYEKSQDKK